MSPNRWAQVVLRVGVAFALLYPPVDAIFHPYAWVDFFPPFVASFVHSETTLLLGWGVVQGALALWILSGKKIFWPSVAAAALLCLIVVFNIPIFSIVFRDLSIACAAAALALMSRAE